MNPSDSGFLTNNRILENRVTAKNLKKFGFNSKFLKVLLRFHHFT